MPATGIDACERLRSRHWSPILEVILATIVLFSLGFAGMAVGVMVKGAQGELSGSCGGVANDGSCGTCGRKSAQVCPSDEPLVQIAQLGHPDPTFHR